MCSHLFALYMSQSHFVNNPNARMNTEVEDNNPDVRMNAFLDRLLAPAEKYLIR